MGAQQSREQRWGSPAQQHPHQKQLASDQPSAQLQRRIQLLEELCSHVEPGRRAEVLQQLAGGQADSETLQCANVLDSRPAEFSPGRLIAAGSYGRVYAGTYREQPAALKLLLLDEETAHAILNEVRLCLKLNHKNLVQLLDCAVVVSNKQAAAAGYPAQPSPSTFTGQHQILPVFGVTPASPATPSAYSYLPIVAGSTPFSSSSSQQQQQQLSPPAFPPLLPHQHVGSSAGADGSPTIEIAHDGRAASLPCLGHACFEVWIAMELCDGGTLAEQLQQGFHCFPGSAQIDMEQLLQVSLDIARALAYMHRESVCHGDLKTENVLLKTMSPASAADLQRTCSSCGNSCCGHSSCDECAWLTFFCNSTGTSNTNGSRYSRSCSGDSCLSCYYRGTDAGSSSPDTCSTTSSNASGPNAERRSRPSGFKGSQILSGLCCMGSPSSCVTQDDAWEEEKRVAMSGCFSCSGCGVMSLEPSVRAGRINSAAAGGAAAAGGTLQHQEQQPLPQQEQLLLAGAASDSAGQPAMQLLPVMRQKGCGMAAYTGSGMAADAAAAATAAAMQQQPYGSNIAGAWGISSSMPPPIVEGQEQLPVYPVRQPGCSLVAAQSELQLGSSSAPEEIPEVEEHVAPLSLYTQARQRRRSRCLPPNVVLPTALAAAAAAAFASPDMFSDPTTSGSSSGSDEEAAHTSRVVAHSRSSLQDQPPGADSLASLAAPVGTTATGPHDGSAPTAGAAGGGSSSSSKAQPPDGPSWHEAAALPGAGGGPACHDVYAHSMMMLPQVPRRARRHSYCYGTASSYGADTAFGFGRPLGATPGSSTPASSLSGLSASEVAAAIAAAAEAVRGTPPAPEGAPRRNRRMSWDDRMLRQHHQSPSRSGLGGFLGAALPGLSRLGAEAAAMQSMAGGGASAAAGGPYGSRRTRRHSWAGYLQPDMFAAAAGPGMGAPAFAAGLGPGSQQHLQQQQDIPAGSYNMSLYGAGAVAPRGGHSTSSNSNRGVRKVRRHSWAGYGLDQPGSKPYGLRALSSCFAAADGSMQQQDGGAHSSSVHSSPQRHLFGLPQLSACWDSSCMRPLDDPGYDLDTSRHALLERGPSSNAFVDSSNPDCLLLQGGEADDTAAAAAAVGCFGKWCSSGTNSPAASSSMSGAVRGPRGGRRRSSWCCGAGSEADLWAGLGREESCSQLRLLADAAPLSVALLPGQPPVAPRRPRRDRRTSWDGFRYRRLSHNWGRKASSLDAQVSTPDSWRSHSQQLGSFIMDSPAASRSCQLVSGSGDAQECADQQQLYVPPAVSPATSSSTPGAQPKQGAGDAGSAGAAAADAAICSTPKLGSSPGSDTRPEVQSDQSVSGLPTPLPLQLPGATVRRSQVRVSLEHPLSPVLPPLPPSSRQQQQHLQAGTAHFVLPPPLAAASADTLAATMSSRAGEAAGLWQQQQQQPVAVNSVSAVAAAGPAAAGAPVRQVVLADLLQLGSVAPGGPLVCSSAAAAAPEGSTLLDSALSTHDQDASSAQDPFTGSFALQLSSVRNASMDAGGGAGGAAERGHSRGRRWSTGVHAHKLLKRKELLDAIGSDVLLGMGVTSAAAGGAVAHGGLSTTAVAAAGEGTGVSVVAHAAGPQQQQPATDPQQASQPAHPLPQLLLGDAAALARVGSPGSQGGGSSSTSSKQQQARGSLASSATASAAINVLGMPRARPAVVSQRRMSYDTAIGTYQLVAQLEPGGLLDGAATNPFYQQGGGGGGSGNSSAPQGQQQQRQPSPRYQQQGVQVLDLLPTSSHQVSPTAAPGMQNLALSPRIGSPPAASHNALFPAQGSHQQQQQQHEEDVLPDDEQMQHCQAQMQRLLDALARKGYGGYPHSDSGLPTTTGNSSSGVQAGTASQQQKPQQQPSARPVATASLQHQRQVAQEVTQLPQRRFCAKVCDFGFSKCLRAGQSHCSTASAGTITHQAPEVLRHGHLSPAADVYAFGIILWELLTHDRPFKGLLEGDLVVGVCDRGLRPVFPPGCPAHYVALAQQCWSDDPSHRPSAAELVKRLNELLYEERRARLRASVGAPGGGVPSTSHEACRRRRHSMPVAGYMRQRRRSRRMSLFLLPFTRQPAVPEDAPLDQQLDDTVRCTVSGSHSCFANHTGSNAAAGSNRSSLQSDTQQQQQQQRGVTGSGGSSSLLRAPARGGAHGSGPCAVDSSSGHCLIGMSGHHVSSGSNGVASAGGLLASSSTLLGRLKGTSTHAASPAGASPGPNSAANAAAPAGVTESGALGDGTEWFQSF